MEVPRSCWEENHSATRAGSILTAELSTSGPCTKYIKDHIEGGRRSGEGSVSRYSEGALEVLLAILSLTKAADILC